MFLNWASIFVASRKCLRSLLFCTRLFIMTTTSFCVVLRLKHGYTSSLLNCNWTWVAFHLFLEVFSPFLKSIHWKEEGWQLAAGESEGAGQAMVAARGSPSPGHQASVLCNTTGVAGVPKFTWSWSSACYFPRNQTSIAVAGLTHA